MSFLFFCKKTSFGKAEIRSSIICIVQPMIDSLKSKKTGTARANDRVAAQSTASFWESPCLANKEGSLDKDGLNAL